MKTHSPSLALKRFLSHVIAWDTHAFTSNLIRNNSSRYFYIVDIFNLCVMCGSADFFDKWARSRLAN